MGSPRTKVKWYEAVHYIQDLIQEYSVQGLKVESHSDLNSWSYWFKAYTEFSKEPLNIKFSEDRIDDLEHLLKQRTWVNSEYGLRFKYFIDFKISIELGKSGLLRSDFKFSDIFLEENRKRKDWWKDRFLSVFFAKDISNSMHEGFTYVEAFLDSSLRQFPESRQELKDLEEDLERVKAIKHYYDEHKSFEESAASVKSLSLLKTAALCKIVEFERRLDVVKPPPVVTASVIKKISVIAEGLRGEQFLEVAFPSWTEDCLKRIPALVQ